MCDENTVQDAQQAGDTDAITRREFNSLTAGAAVAFSLPASANAKAVSSSDVRISTPDGSCDAFFVHPTEGDDDLAGGQAALRGTRQEKLQMERQFR